MASHGYGLTSSNDEGESRCSNWKGDPPFEWREGCPWDGSRFPGRVTGWPSAGRAPGGPFRADRGLVPRRTVGDPIDAVGRDDTRTLVPHSDVRAHHDNQPRGSGCLRDDAPSGVVYEAWVATNLGSCPVANAAVLLFARSDPPRKKDGCHGSTIDAFEPRPVAAGGRAEVSLAEAKVPIPEEGVADRGVPQGRQAEAHQQTFLAAPRERTGTKDGPERER